MQVGEQRIKIWPLVFKLIFVSTVRPFDNRLLEQSARLMDPSFLANGKVVHSRLANNINFRSLLAVGFPYIGNAEKTT